MTTIKANQNNNPSKPATVVFDLDGTLVHSAPDIRTAVNQALAPFNVRALSLDEVTLMIGKGLANLLNLAFQALDVDAKSSVVEQTYRSLIESYSANPASLSTLYPNTIDTLVELQTRGHRLSVCTNKKESIAIEILHELGVEKYFSSVVGGRDNLPSKPDPAMLIAAVEECGGDCQHSVMVGDSISDTGAASAAGIPCIVVNYGYSQQPAHLLGGYSVVSDMREVPAVIDQIASD